MEDLIEARRKGFEAWILSAYMSDGDGDLVSRDNDGEYYSVGVAECWETYQAALDSVVVELPPVELLTADDGVDAEIMEPRRVIEAIHAAGIKTKVKA